MITSLFTGGFITLQKASSGRANAAIPIERLYERLKTLRHEFAVSDQ
jgi:hypothetical protein